MKDKNILLALLHNKGIYINKTLNNKLSNLEARTLFISSIISFAIFGFLIGISHSFAQAIASTIKVPILFLLTTVICFPTLYFFLAILGLRQNFYQLASFILVCLTIIAGVIIVFAPISFFFLVTTSDYHFFKLLNVVIFATAGFVGIYIFYKNLDMLIKKTVDKLSQDRIKKFLVVWLLMFGFIGCQLSYTLSPFFGDPSEDFILLTELQRNFFTDILKTISNLKL